MAGKAIGADKFANIAYLSVTESVADTLTFAQLALANTLMSEKMALVIHRVDLYMTPMENINATTEYVECGLCLSDRVTNLAALDQPEILMWQRFQRLDYGAAATGFLFPTPIVRDFENLPGGGILVPADRLYLGINSVGSAAVMTAKMRLYYTVFALSTADYWELIEARRVMTT